MNIRLMVIKGGYAYTHDNCGGVIEVGKMGRRHAIRCVGCGTYAPFTRAEGVVLPILGKVYSSTNEELVEIGNGGG